MKHHHVRAVVAVVEFAVIALLVAAAFAQPVEKAADRPTDLTVEQALNVSAGVDQLNSFETVDKDGKPARGYYKFSADLRLIIATNMDVGRTVQSRFSTARNAIVMQMSDGTGRVPEDKTPLLTVEVDKLMKAPARAGYVRIKLADLKLDENPTISGAVISLILPILDR